MSEEQSVDLQKPEIISVDETDKQNFYNFWSKATNKSIYNSLLNGIQLAKIAEIHNLTVTEVQQVVTSKYFIAKLQSFLNGLIFMNNTARVIASEDVFNKLWTKVKDNINEIAPEICLKELMKMLPQRQTSISINKPTNVTINSSKNKSDKLPEEFGYKELENIENFNKTNK